MGPFECSLSDLPSPDVEREALYEPMLSPRRMAYARVGLVGSLGS